MIRSEFKQILSNKIAFNCIFQFRCFITTQLKLKQCRIDELYALLKNKSQIRIMSSVRFILRDFGINRLRSIWTRGVNVGNFVRRYRRDRSVRDVIVCFRQSFFRPRRTLLLSATAAYKARTGDDEKPPNCEQNIPDEELEVNFHPLSTDMWKRFVKLFTFTY